MTDIVKDTFDRIRSAMVELGLLSPDIDDKMRLAERAVRQDWGGERPYIAKGSEDAARQMSARNRAIIRDWKNGERLCFIARKYGISRQRVKQIIEG